MLLNRLQHGEFQISTTLGVHNMKIVKVSVWVILASSLVASANAGYVTVSLAPVANDTLYYIQNPPVGLQTLGGVPFNIPVSGNTTWSAGTGTPIGIRTTVSMQLPMSVFGASAVDTIINLGWGVLGSRTVTATFIGTGGANYSLDLETGSDMRNWLDTPYCCNTINGTTTTQVFQSFSASPGQSNLVARLDKQHIVLPASFATQTLTKFILTDSGISGDVTNTIYDNSEAQRSFIYGVTVTTVPEPTTLIMLVIGTVGMPGRRRAA